LGATLIGGRVWYWRDCRWGGNFRRVGAARARAGFSDSLPAFGICRLRRLYTARPPSAGRSSDCVECGRTGCRLSRFFMAGIRIAGVSARPDYRSTLDGSACGALRFIFAPPGRAAGAESRVRLVMGSPAEILRNVTTGTVTTMLLKKGIRRSWMAGAMPFGFSGRRVVGPAFTLRFVPVREDL